MNKFDIEYNKLLLQSKILIAENDNETSEDPFKKQNQNIQIQSKQTKSNSFDWISNMILPTLLGLGSASMFFGKGLFGLGSKNKFFGGWGGQAIGGLGLLALLPGLWSDKSIGQRFTGAFSKFGNGQILDGLKQLVGISPAADKVLKNGQVQANSNNNKQEAIEKRRNTYIHNIDDGEKILKYLKANGYNELSDLFVVTENISLFLIKPKYQNQIQRYGQNKVNGIIVTNQKGTRAAMFNPRDAVSTLNMKFVNYFAAACDPKINKFLQGRQLNNGLKAIRTLVSKDATPVTWFQYVQLLANGLRSMTVGGLTCLSELFSGFSSIPDIAIPLQIKQPEIVKQQEQVSSDEIAKDFASDEEAKNIKEDPILNKFDERIKNLQEDTKDIYLNMLRQSIQQANQKDPDSYIIEGKIGDKIVYYARRPDNNYLTDKIQETIYFDKLTVQKLEGSGDPELKLQNTLKAIKMPQIMKLKNPGLVLYIKPINIQYLKKVSEVLKNKFNISM